MPEFSGQNNSPLLRVTHLVKHFPVRKGLFGRIQGWVRAVDGVTFSVAPGQTLGLAGESGCGKTTTGRLVLRLLDPTSGEIHFSGTDLASLTESRMRPFRRNIQIIFQDPFSSLNPRMTAGSIVGEPLAIHGLARGSERDMRVAELFRSVGLDPDHRGRYPHEFSGGQRQRIGIARALALRPKLIIADEPVSALDVSIQAQIINLLIDLKQEYGLSYLFIAHDLSLVRHISDVVAIMYLGRIVEKAEKKELYANPLHPYTKALLASVPNPDPSQRKSKKLLEGDVPSPLHPPSGCHFHPRCPYRMPMCNQVDPGFLDAGNGHLVACHLYPGK